MGYLSEVYFTRFKRVPQLGNAARIYIYVFKYSVMQNSPLIIAPRIPDGPKLDPPERSRSRRGWTVLYPSAQADVRASASAKQRTRRDTHRQARLGVWVPRARRHRRKWPQNPAKKHLRPSLRDRWVRCAVHPSAQASTCPALASWSRRHSTLISS